MYDKFEYEKPKLDILFIFPLLNKIKISISLKVWFNIFEIQLIRSSFIVYY
jgi:hypothetical protein